MKYSEHTRLCNVGYLNDFVVNSTPTTNVLHGLSAWTLTLKKKEQNVEKEDHIRDVGPTGGISCIPLSPLYRFSCPYFIPDGTS